MADAVAPPTAATSDGARPAPAAASQDLSLPDVGSASGSAPSTQPGGRASGTAGRTRNDFFALDVAAQEDAHDDAQGAAALSSDEEAEPQGGASSASVSAQFGEKIIACPYCGHDARKRSAQSGAALYMCPCSPSVIKTCADCRKCKTAILLYPGKCQCPARTKCTCGRAENGNGNRICTDENGRAVCTYCGCDCVTKRTFSTSKTNMDKLRQMRARADADRERDQRMNDAGVGPATARIVRRSAPSLADTAPLEHLSPSAHQRAPSTTTRNSSASASPAADRLMVAAFDNAVANGHTPTRHVAAAAMRARDRDDALPDNAAGKVHRIARLARMRRERAIGARLHSKALRTLAEAPPTQMLDPVSLIFAAHTGDDDDRACAVSLMAMLGSDPADDPARY
eukprot:Unigene1657_Nuclearia_a/m.5104 Unigene1657_Nuclearia_a/g.5104  ORF Unigene1657_Nuclearia_a/g.5104 Unigene1657_Nuclearia_a/m.5104 type:complete len:399 (-) Unigene1657_Nuclearia_a:31-1227(-)